MHSDPSISPSELFAEVLEGLSTASSAVDILLSVGRRLKQQLALEHVWIGHPATLETETLRCYWILLLPSEPEVQNSRTPTSQLRVICPQILQDLQEAPYHLLGLDTDHPSIWQEFPNLDLREGVLSPVEELMLGMTQIQAVQASRLTQLAEPQIAQFDTPMGEQPQVLGACYPQGDSPWLLGLVGDLEPLIRPVLQRDLGLILQLTTLALERQGFLQRAQQAEQKQRLTANRWMDRFRVATEANRQVVYEWEIDTEQMEWASTLRSVFGHSVSEEVETRRWWIGQVHPEDRQRVIRQISQCLDDLQVFLCEYRWQRADGYYAWVRDYGRILCGPQGFAVRMIGSLEDISARRRTTQLLRHLRRELQTMMTLSPVPLLIVGADLQIVETNPAFQALLGYDPETLHPITLAQIVHPADLDADLRERRLLLEGQQDSVVTEKRLIHTAGHEITAQITISLLGDGLIDREQIWRIREL